MKEKRPTLCIVAGPNGSGKTFYLLNNYNYAPVFLSLGRMRETGAFLCF